MHAQMPAVRDADPSLVQRLEQALKDPLHQAESLPMLPEPLPTDAQPSSASGPAPSTPSMAALPPPSPQSPVQPAGATLPMPSAPIPIQLPPSVSVDSMPAGTPVPSPGRPPRPPEAAQKEVADQPKRLPLPLVPPSNGDASAEALNMPASLEPSTTPRGAGATGGHQSSMGSQGSLTPQQPLDPNRAFQAINAETLEAASQDVDYPVPPQTVRNLQWLLP